MQHGAVSIPAIPEVDAGLGGAGATARACPERLTTLLDLAESQYSRLGLRLGDRVTRLWLERSNNPYLPELEALAAEVGRPGIFALNGSYEWACTSGACPHPDGVGMRLLRVLDWRMAGLGRTLILSRHEGPAGGFHVLGWPGFSGVITGLGAGRFAVAINQPPIPGTGVGLAWDWLVARAGVWKAKGLPPAHLLRQVFEQAADFDEALERLRSAPVALPVFFTLVGPRPGQAVVIERTPRHAELHRPPAAIANHWLALPLKGRPRGRDSAGRLAQMRSLVERSHDDLAWLAPPILNKDTRLACLLCPGSGRLVAQGWEQDGPATAVLDRVV